MHSKSNPSIPSSGFKSGVTNEVQNFLEDIEDLVKETTSLTGEELNRAKAKLSEREYFLLYYRSRFFYTIFAHLP